MPDMMMPQVKAPEPPPAPGQKAGQGGSPAPGAEETNGFSRMLDESMETRRDEAPARETTRAGDDAEGMPSDEASSADTASRDGEETRAQAVAGDPSGPREKGSRLPEEGNDLPAEEEVALLLAGVFDVKAETASTGAQAGAGKMQQSAAGRLQSSIEAGAVRTATMRDVFGAGEAVAEKGEDAVSLEEALRAVLGRERPLLPVRGPERNITDAAAMRQALAGLEARLPASLQIQLPEVSGTAVAAGVSSSAVVTGTVPQNPGAVPTAVLNLPQPLQQPGWDNALGERVVWMVGQRLQSAEIRLNPPQLGPIEVRVNLNHDQSQAQVSFTAQHAVVREALDAAVPRLRELFAEQGLSLGQVDVSDRSFADQRQDAEAGRTAAGGLSGGMDEAEELSVTPLAGSVAGTGMLDVFV